MNVYFNQKDFQASQKTLKNVPSILTYYQNTFGYKMDESLNLILTSSENHQEANGFSTPLPFNLTMFYAGGAESVNNFASISWLDELSTHEIAHNFQMNSKNNFFSKAGNTLFGNTPLTILFGVLPIITLPNLMLPQYTIEGNAVLNEALFNNGGRLFSGAQRAIAFAYYRSGKFIPNNIMNRQIEFPFGAIPYIISGYFHAYLAERFGIKKVNSFYQENSKKSFLIFALNDTYLKTYAIGYKQLFKDFLRSYNPLFSTVTQLKGTFIAKDFYRGQMTKDRHNILFVTRGLTSEPVLYSIHDQTFKITTSEIGDWPYGKPIIYKSKFYTAASSQTSYKKKAIGLFNSRREVKQGFMGKSVQDISSQNILYFDITKSYSQPHLYLNNQLYSIAHSTAIFDKDKNIYYFKNIGKMRTLYQNKKPLVSFQGFWGFPIGVINKNIYFISNSQKGASLFSYDFSKHNQKKIILRRSTADNLITARMINSNQFIAKTIKENSYEYILAKIDLAKKQKPFEYRYSFENHAKINLFKTKIKEEKDSQVKNIHEYNSLTNIKYVGNTFNMFIISKQNYLVSTLFSFSDPLLQNSFSFGYTQTDEKKYILSKYTNSRYRLQYDIQATHLLANSTQLQGSFLQKSSKVNASFKLFYPFLVNDIIKSSIDFVGYSDDEDIHKNPFILEYSYQYSQRYGRAVYSKRAFKANFYLKYDQQSYYSNKNKGDLFLFGGKMQVQKSFDNEFSLLGKIKFSKANKGNIIKIDDQASLTIDPTDFILSSLTNFRLANQVSSLSLKLSQTFYFDFYHRWFPWSLRREIIFAEVETLNLKYDGGQNIVKVSPFNYYTRKRSILETRIGLIFEILSFHNLVSNVKVQYIHNSEDGDTYSMGFNFLL